MLLVCMVGLWNFGNAQVEEVPQDTIPRNIPGKVDSVVSPIVGKVTAVVTPFQVTMSKDSLDAKVEYGSLDSNYFDNKAKQVHLFGEAYVRYKDLELTADYIIVDLDSSIATAQGRLDSLGNMRGEPHFKMGEEEFSFKKMRYNFQTRRGIIYEALTKETDLFIHARKTKFVAADPETGQHDDILYARGGLITSCDHPHPHFGIRASKIKTIPDKLAVVGTSHLEILGIPTPLVLPFGFYPISDTRKAGVIFPRDYEQSPQLGFGIRDVGYYLPISDWADLKILTDIYFNGTWGVGLNSNYVKKYKYRGNVDLRYAHRVTEPDGTYKKLKNNSFSIRISHNQDPKSNPYSTLGGSINIQTNNFDNLNYNDAQSVLTNSLSSNFSYTRTFLNKPYTFSAAFNHSQNTQNHLVIINAPDLNFRLNRIYPFKRKNGVGNERFYEKIGFQYSVGAKGQVQALDTLLFDSTTWDNAQYGAQHRANVFMNFNMFKYFNVTPNIDYGETWYFKTQDREHIFDPTDPAFVRPDTIWYPDSSGFIIVPDTISGGIIRDTLEDGFKAFRSVSASLNINTQLFGRIEFKQGWLRGIRHVIKPTIGFTYTPQSPSSYFQRVGVSAYYPDSTRLLSVFDNLLYSSRPTLDKQANITYSITNLLEAKLFSRKDSTEQRVKLFDNINVTGSYNIAADTNRFSPVNISSTTRLFKGITTISMGATYSFYDKYANGLISKEFYWNTKGAPLRFDNLRMRFSTRIRVSDVLSIFSPNEKTNEEKIKDSGAIPDKRDLFSQMLNEFSISHEFQIVRMGRVGRDTTAITTNSINMQGSMRISPNWSIRFGNIGYDLIRKELTYPDLGIARDLHCWQIAFNVQPTRGTYSFYIGVKPGTFEFLKFPNRRNNYDSSNGF